VWILIYKVWKFGSNPHYHGRNTAFFLGDCFLLAHPVYHMSYLSIQQILIKQSQVKCRSNGISIRQPTVNCHQPWSAAAIVEHGNEGHGMDWRGTWSWRQWERVDRSTAECAEHHWRRTVTDWHTRQHQRNQQPASHTHTHTRTCTHARSHTQTNQQWQNQTSIMWSIHCRKKWYTGCLTHHNYWFLIFKYKLLQNNYHATPSYCQKGNWSKINIVRNLWGDVSFGFSQNCQSK